MISSSKKVEGERRQIGSDWKGENDRKEKQRKKKERNKASEGFFDELVWNESRVPQRPVKTNWTEAFIYTLRLN